MRYRLWSEEVDYERLRSRALLASLRDRDIELLVAVRPTHLEQVSSLLSACRAAGVRLGFWPMLEDEAGRWVNGRTASAFVPFVEAILKAAGGQPDVLAIDLEPPLFQARRIITGHASALARNATRARGMGRLKELIRSLKDRGVETLAAVLPMVLSDARGPLGLWSRGWQRALDMEVDGLPFDHVCVMAYSSLMEGYSRGVLRRNDCRALMARITRASLKRYGSRACIGLGAIGTGALLNEPVYRSKEELMDDCGLVCGAGAHDVALFDLGGMIRRPPVDGWLDALVLSKPPPPSAPLTVRAAAAIAGSVGASLAFEAAGRLAEPFAPRKQQPPPE